MSPNPISTRTPVHVSFNPHPVGSTAFNDYLHQRGEYGRRMVDRGQTRAGHDTQDVIYNYKLGRLLHVVGFRVIAFFWAIGFNLPKNVVCVVNF